MAARSRSSCAASTPGISSIRPASPQLQLHGQPPEKAAQRAGHPRQGRAEHDHPERGGRRRRSDRQHGAGPQLPEGPAEPFGEALHQERRHRLDADPLPGRVGHPPRRRGRGTALGRRLRRDGSGAGQLHRHARRRGRQDEGRRGEPPVLPRGAGGQGGDPERRPRRSLHQPPLREAQDHPRGPQHRRCPS